MLDFLIAERVAESEQRLGKQSVAMLQKAMRDAVTVLERTGVHCQSPQVREVLENTGLAAMDERSSQMHILPDLVYQAIKSTPKNDQFWLPLQSYGIGGTAPYILDDATHELKTAEAKDIERLAKMVEKTEEISFMGRGVILPGQNAKAMQIVCDHTQKPFYFGVRSQEELDLAQKLYESRGNTLLIWDVLKSPLDFAPEMISVFIDCLQRGLPVILATMPMPAINAPYSMSGLLTLCFAEFLAALVIAQTIRPGIITVCGSFPSYIDIQNNYTLDFGDKYHNLANMLMSHLPLMLDIPACQSGCTTNEASITPRSVEDAKMGYAIFKKYGVHMIRHAFGFTKDLLSVSFDKIKKTTAVFQETSPDSAPNFTIPAYDDEALEVIQRNASHANYMQDDHTLKHIGKSFCD